MGKDGQLSSDEENAEKSYADILYDVTGRLTLSLNHVSLFGAGLAVAIAADMVEGEEEMMLIVELGGQLNLILRNK